MRMVRWGHLGLLLLVGGLGMVRVPAATLVVRAGLPYTLEVWETEDGLPQNSVIALAQGREGYLWLGTLNGLVRFDGSRFAVFDEDNTPGLPGSQIVNLLEDAQGSLWIGTETDGAAVVKGGRMLGLDIGRGRREGRVVSMCQDASGAVWLYTADGQLCRHAGGTMDVWGGGEPQSSQRFVVSDSDGPVWVGGDNGIYALDPARVVSGRPLPVGESRRVRRLDYLLGRRAGGLWCLADGRIQTWRTNRLERDFGPYPWGPTTVSAACEDREGNLIVGTLGSGLHWLDLEGRMTVLSTNQGLSHNWILSLLLDREGSLWVGTDGGGLNRVRRQVLGSLPASLGSVIQSVCPDGQGGVWVGSNGRGAGYYRGDVLTWHGTAEGLANPFVRAVHVDRQGRVLVGTVGAGLFAYQEGRFVPVPSAGVVHPVINALFEDRQGRLWVGTEGGLAQREATGERPRFTSGGVSGLPVRGIAEDAEGRLWVATAGSGVARLHEGKWTWVRRSDGLPHDDVASVWVDAEQVVWVTTRGGGLGRWSGAAWTRCGTKEGLVSNSLGYLLDDGLGNLWIGSNAGLMRVPKAGLAALARGEAAGVPCRTFGKADGLPSGECSVGSLPGANRVGPDTLWFPTIKGVALANPARIPFNPQPPPVLIESVMIDGQPQGTNGLRPSVGQGMRVPPGRERLEIHYTSLSLEPPERSRFKYRLEGYETASWTEAGGDRVARYTRVPPGTYTFRVTACNEDGVWNPEGATLSLVIVPPFWRTWWFVTLAPLGVLGLVVGAVHYWSTQRLQRQLERMRQQQALEKERARIARDLHDQLGASLTQVSLLGEMAEADKDLPEEVVGHARQITQTARETTHVLDEIVWAVNPSNDTLEGLVNYICKQAQDYLKVAGLRHRLDVPAQLPPVSLPPDVRHNVFLAAKEAVTNIVRHAQATSASIRLQLEPSQFILEIADNGRGMDAVDPAAARNRNGLRNMRKRLEDAGGRCEFLAAPEGGTLVRLTVPLPGRGNSPARTRTVHATPPANASTD